MAEVNNAIQELIDFKNGIRKEYVVPIKKQSNSGRYFVNNNGFMVEE
jgi:hypothetical protein